MLFLVILACEGVMAQGSCVVVADWSGGWCDICGGPTGNYACNSPGIGTWDNGCKDFFDCVPTGNFVTAVNITLYWSSGDNSTSIDSFDLAINGTTIGIIGKAGAYDCGYCIVDNVSQSFSSLPGYIYGGINTFCLNFTGAVTCVDRAEITLTYSTSSSIGTPDSINGNQTPCLGDSISYSAAPVFGATSYNWILPLDWVLQSGQGDTLINVIAGNDPGSICVQACDSAGCGLLSCLPVQPSSVSVNLGLDTASCQLGAIVLDAQNSGATYLWQDSSASQTYSVLVTGQYRVTVTDIYGCTATDSTYVWITPSSTQYDSLEICSGDSAFLGGAYQMSSGDYIDIYSGVGGCDSIWIMSLGVNPSYDEFDTLSICENDSIIIGGTYYSLPGTYADSLNTAKGCDSVIWNNLVVNPVQQTNSQAFICDGDSILLGGDYAFIGGIYLNTYTDANGCDSSMSTSLTVHPKYDINEIVIICYGDSIFLEGMYRFNSGVYNDLSNTANGCDSTIQTTLIVDSVATPVITKAGFILTSTVSFQYQWYYNGTLIAGAIDQSIGVVQDGYYKVLVTDSNGCSAFSDYYLVTILSVDDIEKDNKLGVYPNPTDGIFEFQLNALKNSTYEIRLYDLTGRVVFSSDIIASGTEYSGNIDLSPYSKGVYYLEIFNPTEFYTARIIYQD